MRYADFLPEQGTIGFVAPSFGCASEPYRTAFDSALDIFHSMGYHTLNGPNVYKSDGIVISSTPAGCAAELMDFWQRKDCDVLISCGGGELMCEDLPYVDFSILARSDPRWYMGFSDNTNLTFLLPVLADTASIYGPCAASFGMRPWHPAICDAWDVLTGHKLTVSGYDRYESVKPSQGNEEPDAEDPLSPYQTDTDCVRVRYPDEDCSVSGRLIGGCLDVISLFPGTPYDRVSEFSEKYSDDGILWFLEACDLNPMEIRRRLWHLDQAGWFSHVSGFLIGRPLCHGTEMMGMDQYNAVTDILGRYNVPIIMDLDIGHIPPMMPLICGSCATARITGNDFTVSMELI